MEPTEADTPSDSQEKLFQTLYEKLRAIARRRMVHENSDSLLQPTALVNEAYLRFCKRGEITGWNDQAHFLNDAATVMRRILVDTAREKNASKRGGGQVRISLSGELPERSQFSLDVLALHEALAQFELVDGAKAKLIKLRYFAGLSIEESAEVLGISKATAYNYWHFSRAWLEQQMSN